MFKIRGVMKVLELASSQQQLDGFKMRASQSGSDLEAVAARAGLKLEANDKVLYFRAKMMGYDLPNGNGDAVPRVYAAAFGPSFIGKQLNVNHNPDPEHIIGRILTTFHVEQPLTLSAEDERIIGKNVLSGIEDAEPQELQLEGICMIDRTCSLGDDIAKKLISGTLSMVSQEAYTEFCQCSVCGHKMQGPRTTVCGHLDYGSLMVEAYQVEGKTHKVLAYKEHHNPVGEGLAVVNVGAYSKADVLDLVAKAKTGSMKSEEALGLLAFQEEVFGRNTLLAAAKAEIEGASSVESALKKLNGVEALALQKHFQDLAAAPKIAQDPKVKVGSPTPETPSDEGTPEAGVAPEPGAEQPQSATPTASGESLDAPKATEPADAQSAIDQAKKEAAADAKAAPKPAEAQAAPEAPKPDKVEAGKYEKYTVGSTVKSKIGEVGKIVEPEIGGKVGVIFEDQQGRTDNGAVELVRIADLTIVPPAAAPASGYVDQDRKPVAPGDVEKGKEMAKVRRKAMEDFDKEFLASPEIAKNGMPYENRQLTIKRPMAKDEHSHGVGSDSIRHQHGPYEKGHVHENKTNEKGVGSPEVQMESKAFREGEGVQEQSLGEAKGRHWVDGSLESIDTDKIEKLASDLQKQNLDLAWDDACDLAYKKLYPSNVKAKGLRDYKFEHDGHTYTALVDYELFDGLPEWVPYEFKDEKGEPVSDPRMTEALHQTFGEEAGSGRVEQVLYDPATDAAVDKAAGLEAAARPSRKKNFVSEAEVLAGLTDQTGAEVSDDGKSVAFSYHDKENHSDEVVDIEVRFEANDPESFSIHFDALDGARQDLRFDRTAEGAKAAGDAIIRELDPQDPDVVATLFRSNDLASSYWTLFTNGKLLGRFHLAALCGGNFAQKAKAGDKELPLSDYLVSDAYGQAMVAHVKRFGTETVVAQLTKAEADYEAKKLTIKAFWVDKVRDNWTDLEDLKSASDNYGIAERLGYDDVEALWEENPYVVGSVNPADLQIVEEARAKEMKQALDSEEGINDQAFRQKFLTQVEPTDAAVVTPLPPSVEGSGEKISKDFGDRRFSDMIPWSDLTPQQQKEAEAMFVNQIPVSEHVGHNEPIGNEHYHYQVNKSGKVGGRRFLTNKGMHKGRVENLEKMKKPNLPASLKATQDFAEFVSSLDAQQLAAWIVAVESDDNGMVKDKAGNEADNYMAADAGEEALAAHIMENQAQYEPQMDKATVQASLKAAGQPVLKTMEEVIDELQNDKKAIRMNTGDSPATGAKTKEDVINELQNDKKTIHMKTGDGPALDTDHEYAEFSNKFLEDWEKRPAPRGPRPLGKDVDEAYKKHKSSLKAGAEDAKFAYTLAFIPHESPEALQQLKDWATSKDITTEEEDRSYVTVLKVPFLRDVDKADDPDEREFIQLAESLGIKTQSEKNAAVAAALSPGMFSSKPEALHARGLAVVSRGQDLTHQQLMHALVQAGLTPKHARSLTAARGQISLGEPVSSSYVWAPNLVEAKKLKAEAREWIKSKVERLCSTGKSKDQAVAAAYSMARKKGYDVPETASLVLAYGELVKPTWGYEVRTLGRQGYMALADIEGPPYNDQMDTGEQAMSQSNYEEVEKRLPEGGEEGAADWASKNEGEPYPGDVYYAQGYILVYSGAPKAMATAQAIADELSSYPLLNEDRFSELEFAAYQEALPDALEQSLNDLGYNSGIDELLSEEEMAQFDALPDAERERIYQVFEHENGKVPAVLGDEMLEKLERALLDSMEAHAESGYYSQADVEKAGIPRAEDIARAELDKSLKLQDPSSDPSMREKEKEGQQRLPHVASQKPGSRRFSVEALLKAEDSYPHKELEDHSEDENDLSGEPSMELASRISQAVGGTSPKHFGEFRYSDKNDSSWFASEQAEILVSVFEDGSIAIGTFTPGSAKQGFPENRFESISTFTYAGTDDQSVASAADDIKWIDDTVRGWQEKADMEASLSAAVEVAQRLDGKLNVLAAGSSPLNVADQAQEFFVVKSGTVLAGPFSDLVAARNVQRGMAKSEPKPLTPEDQAMNQAWEDRAKRIDEINKKITEVLHRPGYGPAEKAEVDQLMHEQDGLMKQNYKIKTL